MRFAYGEALARLGGEIPSLIALDADVSHSTQSLYFACAYPERFINVGIAEANMVCVAAGLAATGYIPVVNTFSFLFSERALDSLRAAVALNDLHVIFAAHYGGLSDCYDGMSHHSVSDLAIIRSIPNMTLIVPSDSAQVEPALRAALYARGPVYLRLCRAETPDFHAPGDPFHIGKINVLKDGGDVTLLACGVMVYSALEAARALENEGISAQVLEAHTLKPFDRETLLAAVARTGKIVTCEEGNRYGGLYEAACGELAGKTPFSARRAAIEDRYTSSGAYHELLSQNGLTAGHIAQLARALTRE